MKGYIDVSLVLQPDKYGTPCRRSPVWILAKCFPLATIADQEKAQRMAHDIQKKLQQSPLPLANFLMDNAEWKRKETKPKGKKRKIEKAGSKSAKKEEKKAKASSTSVKKEEKKPKAGSKSAKKEETKPKWTDLHDELWSLHGDRPSKMTRIVSDLEGKLAPREKDIAFC